MDRHIGMTVDNARAFHVIYQYDIAYKLLENKHLSVIMPPVIGLYPLVNYINDIFHAEKRITVIAKDQHEVDFFNETIAGFDCGAPVIPVTVDSFLDSPAETEAYILFNLDQVERVLVAEILVPKKNRIVISIGKPQIDKSGKYLHEEGPKAIGLFSRLTLEGGVPHPMVFPVQSILDIRDIMYAAPEEKKTLVTLLQNTVMLYQMDADKAEKMERESDKTELERLKAELAAVKRLNEAMLLISQSAGIDIDDLQSAAEKIVAIKEKYQVVSESEEADEKAITNLQNETAAVLESMSCLKMNSYNRGVYERILIDLLGDDTWLKLSSNSKDYLISARMNYDAMTSSMDKDKFDYSGVCLQVTKVLDEELTERVYRRYAVYLEDIYPSDSKLSYWPDGLVIYDRRSDTEYIRRPEDFTLGSVAVVIGVNYRGKVLNQKSLDEFVYYAKQELYKPGLSEQKVMSLVTEIAVSAEKVRRDYRNPSAHRERLSRSTAEDCMAYMLEQIKKLKLILQDMRE